MAVTTPSYRPASNLEIARAIRGEASNSYRSRVPEATQANIQNTLERMWDYVPNRNEFIDALVNRIGLTIGKSMTYNNPLAIFKRGMLTNGDTIEEIAVGLAQAHVYDTSREYLEKDIFGQYASEVQSRFHKINRAEWYAVTMNEDLLRRAFLNDDGLWNFAAQIMSSATNGDNTDEFLQTCALFSEYERLGGFFKVNVPDIRSAGSTEADAKTFLRSVRSISDTLPLMPSRHYNAAKMPVFSQKEELVLFMSPEAKAAMDVEALATLFNLEYGKAIERIILIPSEVMGIAGAQAILTTEDFFVITDTLISTTQAANPIGLYSNHFFHHHSIISASPFVPAILFTTEAGDVITMLDEPVTGVSEILVADAETGTTVTNLQRGKMYVAAADAETEGDNTAVRWELVSLAGGPLSARTNISQTGVISMSVDESSSSVKVLAYAVDAAYSDRETLKAEKTFGVVGTRIHVWPTDVSTDSDNDGLVEVTAKEPTRAGDVVTIPTVVGVQYKRDNVDVANGSTFTVTASTVVTAVARSGYELVTGSDASWTYLP